MPLLLEQGDRASVHIAVWRITESEEELANMLPPLALQEQTYLEKISWKPRRIEWLASRLLIYRLTDLYPEICYNQNGQPSVSHCRENISISHTHGYAAVALSARFMPGIDIERPSPRIGKVKNRFLHNEEKEYLEPAFEDQQLGLIWCTKEAIFKKTGQKGLNFHQDILVSAFHPQKEGFLSVTRYPHSKDQSFIQLQYLNKPEFYLVWTIREQ